MTILAVNDDLFAPRMSIVDPWKPRALPHDEWRNIDYRRVYAWRIRTLKVLREQPETLVDAKAYYKTRPGEFIQHWMDTYNPRKVRNKWMPFVFFLKQDEFVQFLEELRRDSQSGLVEKCRDIGATWIACAYSVWSWIFLDDDATGWGSRKQELVDKLGDADSIFEKIRLIIRRLPDIWLPDGFKTRDHATFMKVVNPANGATISGESGDNIGRGGRKSRYWKDESAHYERPEKIEAALGDNTDVQIDISSVNGLGNVFHRRAESAMLWTPGCTIPAGTVRKFIFDWRDHPEKTQEWYDQRRAKAEREGMLHLFAQEVDRNYSAAVSNTIIAYEWLTACVDAHLKVPCLRVPPIDKWTGGLDLADGGVDRNAFSLRQWVILRDLDEWGERDAGVSTRKTIGKIRERGLRGVELEYDSIGIGSAVKSEFNRLIDTGELQHSEISFVAWNAGGKVQAPYETVIAGDPDSTLNRNFFNNMKAQAWWSMRTRVYKTWRAITYGDVYKPEELCSFDSTMPLLPQLLKELAQATEGKATDLRMIVNKTPEGTKSPNLADSVVMNYFPIPDAGAETLVGSYSG